MKDVVVSKTNVCSGDPAGDGRNITEADAPYPQRRAAWSRWTPELSLTTSHRASR